MDVFDAIYGRCSIRSFDSSRSIPDDVLNRILEAATRAPSAGNLQPWRFIVVRDEGVKEDLARAALMQSWITEAPVIVVVCADLDASGVRYGERGRRLYAIQDSAAATMLMLLAAYALGLGACWVGAFDEDSVRKALNLPENIRPLSIVPLGYPAEKPYRTSRIPLTKIVYYDRFG